MRDYDDKQEKKELLSQWKLEADFRNCLYTYILSVLPKLPLNLNFFEKWTD